jgi:DNA-binding MarR family transcriptional regulator
MGLVEDLSAAFVAFTIEVDDAAEGRLTHRTTGRGGHGAWLTSLAMWRNCLQWLPAEGISVGEMIATARTPTNFGGMRRWGYVEMEGWARGAKGRPPSEGLVRPTKRGARAQGVWDGVPEEIERRWAERFGGGPVAELRGALVALVNDLNPSLPDTMPIVRHGWMTQRDGGDAADRPGPVAVADLGFDSLLPRPLTAFALEFEASGKLSLAMHANLLAVLGDVPTALRDLPDHTGIAREQIDNAAGYLERAGLAEIVPTPGAKRGKSVVLTESGTRAKSSGARKLKGLEANWEERHGAALRRVREALGGLASGRDPAAITSDGPGSVLLADLEHPPGTWRAEAKPLARLPRFPLVTHRGGFPDGS